MAPHVKGQLSAHQFPSVYKDLNINLSKLGCVMLDLVPLDSMSSPGEQEALYHAKDKSRFWIDGWVADKTPHITLLYGLMKPAKDWEKYIDTVLTGWSLKEVEIDNIGYFDSPYPDEPYWCIVAHIKPSPDLLEGNDRLKFLPHINTFVGYKPHMTLAYIDKKQGEKYRDGLVKDFNKLWAGEKLKVRKTLNLGGNK